MLPHTLFLAVGRKSEEETRETNANRFFLPRVKVTARVARLSSFSKPNDGRLGRGCIVCCSSGLRLGESWHSTCCAGGLVGGPVDR